MEIAGAPGGVEAGVLERLPDGVGPLHLVERLVELTQDVVVEPRHPVGLPLPPGLVAPLEQGEGLAAMLDPLREPARPEGVPAEHVPGLPLRRRVAATPRRRDGETRVARGLLLIPQIAVG